jgi:hypothetical protein
MGERERERGRQRAPAPFEWSIDSNHGEPELGAEGAAACRGWLSSVPQHPHRLLQQQNHWISSNIIDGMAGTQAAVHCLGSPAGLATSWPQGSVESRRFNRFDYILTSNTRPLATQSNPFSSVLGLLTISTLHRQPNSTTSTRKKAQDEKKREPACH